MKTLSKLLAISLCFCLFNCDKNDPGLTIGNLFISKQHPKPGDSLQLNLKTDKTLDKENFHTFTYLVNNKDYTEDINFKEVDNQWEASIKIPDSAQAIFYNFINENNNYKGYFHRLYNDSAKIPESNLALNYYLISNRPDNIEINTDSLMTVFENDLDQLENFKNKYDKELYWLLSSNNPKKAKEKAEIKIKELSAIETPNENQLSLTKQLYSILDNKTAADSIGKIIGEKFPNSVEARLAKAIEFSKTTEFEKKEELFNEYASTYPNDDRYMSYFVNNLSNVAKSNGEFEKVQSYIKHLTKNTDKASSLNSLAWPMAEKGENLYIAEKLSKESLDLIQTSLSNHLTEKPGFLSPKQYKYILEENYHMYADTYAFILFKQDKIKEAIKYQEAAANHSSSSADIKERYIEFLIADNQSEKAQEKASEYIAKNKATSKMKSYLKDVFKTPEGSSINYDTYIEELEAKGLAYAKEKVKEKMINKSSFDFTLKDLDGNEVSLASLKGKVVVLDFWATWCGPCIASFPAMQEAVNKFKDDENVEFLFIDTMEKGNEDKIKERVTSFISKNNYTFNVLLDEFKTPEANSNEKTSDGFGVTGIPTKFVIGTDGNIKFKSVGYSGHKESSVQEMSIMIELAKAE